jgi:hypothetical protein
MAVTQNPGLVLLINGEVVTLKPSDANSPDRVANGATYELTDPVEIGSAADLNTFLSNQFGVNALPAADTFPSPLDQVYGKLADLVLSVEQFKLNIPPKAANKSPTFTIGLAAEWKAGEEVSLIDGKLAIKGIYVQIVKDDKP